MIACECCKSYEAVHVQEATDICQNCGLDVCDICYDPRDGVCNDCAFEFAEDDDLQEAAN